MADTASAQAAARVLRDASVRAAPVPVDGIARRLGAQVRFEPSRAGLVGLLWRDGDQVILGINSLLPRTRQRFAIAHELGHLLLHPADGLHIDRDFQMRTNASAAPEVQPVDSRDLTPGESSPLLTLDLEAMLHGSTGALAALYAGRDSAVAPASPNGQEVATLPVSPIPGPVAGHLRDQEANQFAVELLLPPAMLRADMPERGLDFEDDDGLQRLAERYQVSLQLLLRRLAELGFLAPTR